MQACYLHWRQLHGSAISGDCLLSVDGLQAVKSQTVVKLSVVSCPPVVEVLITRPHVQCPLGFSVQNGVVSNLTSYYYHTFSELVFLIILPKN